LNKSFVIQIICLHLNIINQSKQLKMKTAINTIAKEAIEDATLEASYNSKKADASLLIACVGIAITLNHLSFENSTAESMFTTLVLQEVRKIDVDFYNEVYPPMHMDENGEYTTDSSKWA
jgi:hypothetical protein